MLRPLIVAAILALVAPTSAQTPTPGTCQRGVAERDLSVSDVLARVFNTGSLFYGGSSQGAYLVPAALATSPMFAAGIWVAGFVDDDLRVAGARYSNFEYWPGPLNPGATLPSPSDCSEYDRIWRVSAADIALYESTGSATPDLASWPVELGAEVTDGDGVPGNYNLPGGDRPRLYGTQMAFWVMNDVGNVHSNSLTAPLGVELRVLAFAIDSPSQPALDQGTFYRYTLVNRNTFPIENGRVALFADPDLGDASDDYIGTDAGRSMVYVYNADNEDGNGTGGTYGTQPPAFGIDLLNGLHSAMYFRNGATPPQSDPSDGLQMYQVMLGRWTDGSPMTEGGSGYNPSSSDVTTLAFPGDPVTNGYWSMPCPQQPCGSPLAPGDLRAVAATTFRLDPEDARTFDVAMAYARGTSNLNSITQLRAASDLIQSRYEAGTLFPPPLNPPVAADPSPTPSSLSVVVSPNPATARTQVLFETAAPGHIRLTVFDVLGREVAVLVDGLVPSGRGEASLNAGRLAPGVYVVAVETSAGRAVRTFSVVR
jgi:hypothetical protein